MNDLKDVFQPLSRCKPSNGYIWITALDSTHGYWAYNSSSLHARINRRVGLQNKPIQN